ncbi:MAG: GIY-YIG nuclease family protein [Anaerolineae bacterium]|nr:GIY-YIG nuclease family protein [Anaerolineae bacterium]
MTKCRTGVYGIRNRVTGGMYVGSTADSFQQRFKVHRKQLRERRHHNHYLQTIFDKRGADALEYLILEEVPPDREAVLLAEQRWIDFYKSNPNTICYNVAPTAWSNKGYRRSEDAIRRTAEASAREFDGLIAPDGTEYSPIFNLSKFCTQHALNYGNIYEVLIGERRHHKGWTSIIHRQTPIIVRGQKYCLVVPSGELHEIDNLTAFAYEHQLSRAGLSNVLAGKRRQHHGWRAANPRQLPTLTPLQIKNRERWLRALGLFEAGLTYKQIAEELAYKDAKGAYGAVASALKLIGKHRDDVLKHRQPTKRRLKIEEKWTTALAMKRSGYSYREIAEKLNYKDFTGAYHAVKRAKVLEAMKIE